MTSMVIAVAVGLGIKKHGILEGQCSRLEHVAGSEARQSPCPCSCVQIPCDFEGCEFL